MPSHQTKVKTMARWGIPDWERPQDYSVLNRKTDLEWRWEFLRRHPRYRAVWKRTAAFFRSAGGQGTFFPSEHLEFGLQFLLDPKKEAADGILATLGVSVVHPLTVLDEVMFIRSVRYPLEKAAGKFPVVFDVSRPIEPQLAKARHLLAEAQKDRCGKLIRAPNLRRPNWTLALRALDGRECGASYAQMMRCFWPNSCTKTEQSARDTYRLAVRLRTIVAE